jgi:hypothetical protein
LVQQNLEMDRHLGFLRSNVGPQSLADRRGNRPAGLRVDQVRVLSDSVGHSSSVSVTEDAGLSHGAAICFRGMPTTEPICKRKRQVEAIASRTRPEIANSLAAPVQTIKGSALE